MNLIFGEMLSQVNPKVVYVVVGILLVSFVISLVKQAIKLAILVLIVTVGVSVLGPTATAFQDRYKFNISNGIATIQVDGKEIKLDKDEITKIELVNGGVAGYVVNVTYKDGLSSVTVPTFMSSMIKSYADKHKIQVEMHD